MATRAERRRSRAHRRRVIAWVAGLTAVVLGAAAAVVVVVASPLGSAHRRSPAPAANAPSPTPAAESATFVGPDGPSANWVIAENQRPGTTAWQITGKQSATGITGYADQDAVQVGQQLSLFVSTEAPTFHVEAYRMGYYQGAGARLVWRSGTVKGSAQAPCPVTPGINMVECHWPAALTLPITGDWPQGEYLLKLVGSGGQQSYVPLTVWDPSSHAAYVMMFADLTEQVFNPFGGYDLYTGATPCAPSSYPCSSRSRVVSFDRPYDNSAENGAGTYLIADYPLTRLMEKHGLDVTYWTDVTLAEHGNLLANHRVLISPAHDEEWSLSMRQAAVAASAQGVNLAFFGASPILRKVRLQPSPLGPDREEVNYRNPSEDPLARTDPARVSQNTWAQAPASDPPADLVGAEYVGFNNHAVFPLQVSDASSWFFAGTGLANGAQVPNVMHSDFQAYDPTLPRNPPNVEILAHSPVTVEQKPNDHFADTTFYTSPTSRAGVWQSGTVAWVTDLIDCPTKAPACPALPLQQMTLNMLRVFGAGPVGLAHPSVSNVAQFYPALPRG